ncbi:MAG: carbon-nitrogen hydrolase family protein, partial [Gammaproteobacteria bacterium]|nr:carbon-nitrogen hydrolase family protein [Gammaproteobacteria bacterium]
AREAQTAMQTGNMDAQFLARIDELSSKLNEELFVRSRDAARAGARLVVWSETAGHVLASGEKQLVERGQALAREHQIYLFLGLGVWHPGSQPSLENKVVAITPSGEVAWQYQKARPIVGSEAPFLPPGHNELATLDTPFGRIGLVICHDLDFADFVAEAGRKDVNLMLAPSADWTVIADLHAKMGVMRAVENGFWLLRPAYDGLSQIASPKGKVVYSEYDIDLGERIFHAEIPMMRNDTVYPHVRAYLPLVALALLIALLLLAWRGDRSRPIRTY